MICLIAHEQHWCLESDLYYAAGGGRKKDLHQFGDTTESEVFKSGVHMQEGEVRIGNLVTRLQNKLKKAQRGDELEERESLK